MPVDPGSVVVVVELTIGGASEYELRKVPFDASNRSRLALAGEDCA